MSLDLETNSSGPAARFSQEEVDRAFEEWNCNCGPAALAACLGWTLGQVRPVLGDFERRGYLSPTTMAQSIARAGFAYRDGGIWPAHGLVRIQFGGPWLRPGVPPKAAYAYTHWVASKRHNAGQWVYDVNAGWLPLDAWVAVLVPRLVASYKRADGTWHTSHSWEIRRARGTGS